MFDCVFKPIKMIYIFIIISYLVNKFRYLKKIYTFKHHNNIELIHKVKIVSKINIL